jgi:hypothetical protein
MEIKQVEAESEQITVLNSVLKTLVSEEDRDDIVKSLLDELSLGNSLFSIHEQENILGFFLLSKNKDEDNDKTIISVTEIWFASDFKEEKVASKLASYLKENMKNNKIILEIILNQEISWIGDVLSKDGYVCEEIKLEKLLPNTNNLADVLELVKSTIPEDRIIQVLMTNENDEYFADYIEEASEISDYLVDGWIPIMVIVTYEPDDQDIDKTIEESNMMINWDDFEIVYRL